MPIFDKENYKILFVHIPKTGGSSIEHWLNTQCDSMYFYTPTPPKTMKVTPQHMPKVDIDVLLNNNYRYSFAIVRNPYDRMESEFFYRQTLASKSNEILETKDFSKWLLNNLDELRRTPFHSDNHFREQNYFIDNSVDTYKFEDGLLNIATQIDKRLNFQSTINLPHEKKSKREKVYWSRRARYKFNQLFIKDFKQFNYDLIEMKKNIGDSLWDSRLFMKVLSMLSYIKR